MLSAACGGDDNTAGKRVVLQTRAAADPELQHGFETATGWEVQLSEAVVAFDAFYYFTGEPAFVRNEVGAEPDPLGNAFERVRRFFTLEERAAHAHPGHYQAGDALGQMLVPGSFDLLGKTVNLGTGDGVTGVYRSGQFVFPETVTDSEEQRLEGHVAVVRGRATRAADGGAEEVFFRLTADFQDVANSASNGEVAGCIFEQTDVEGDGVVTLTVSPNVWFDLVDFSDVAPGSEDEPTEVEHDSVPHIAFALGLAQLSAYKFTFKPVP